MCIKARSWISSVILGVALCSCDKPAPEQIPTTAPQSVKKKAIEVSLNAKASTFSHHLVGHRLIVSNLDQYNWTEVFIELNSQRQRYDGYGLRVGEIKAEGYIGFDISECCKSDGTRFNPLQTRALTIHIYATTMYGRGSCKLEFN